MDPFPQTPSLDSINSFKSLIPQIIWFIPQGLQIIGEIIWLLASLQLISDGKWSKHQLQFIKAIVIWAIGRILASIAPIVVSFL